MPLRTSTACCLLSTLCVVYQAYASADVYYLEVCALNELCSNREELFRLKAGESFRCRSDAAGLARLRVALLEARR